MNKIKLFAASALLAVGTTASAQFTNSSSVSSQPAKAGVEEWSTFYVQWNPSTIAVDLKGADDCSFTGLSLGYSKAFGIARNTPLFIEAGIGLQYSFFTDDEAYDYGGEISNYGARPSEDKYNMLSAKIPVNLTYSWQIPNSKVTVAPYAGLTMRFNIFGNKKTELEVGKDYDGDAEKDYEEEYDVKLDKNLFDKDDMGDKDATWKRFQIGWQIGVNARFNNNLMLGVSYGSDFSELCKKTKINTTSVTLGYCF